MGSRSSRRSYGIAALQSERGQEDEEEEEETSHCGDHELLDRHGRDDEDDDDDDDDILGLYFILAADGLLSTSLRSFHSMFGRTRPNAVLLLSRTKATFRPCPRDDGRQRRGASETCCPFCLD